jgi:hypothetical protein
MERKDRYNQIIPEAIGVILKDYLRNKIKKK